MSRTIIPALLRNISQYNANANALVLDTVHRVSLDEITKPSSPSHGSVFGLLQHILDVEVYYLACCQNCQFDLDVDRLRTVEELRSAWENLEENTSAFLDSIDSEGLMREVELARKDPQTVVPVWQILFHAFTHSAHHRGELSIVLTNMGYPLPAMDSLIYFVEQSGQAWPWG